jgi:hypothetical protein
MNLALVDNRASQIDDASDGPAEYYPFQSNGTAVPRLLVPLVRAQSFPTPGSPAWSYMNRRRADLIRRKVRSALSPAEEEELSRMQKESLAAVERAFPRPPVDLRALTELEMRLKKGQELETP